MCKHTNKHLLKLHYLVKYAMKVNYPYDSIVTEINHEYFVIQIKWCENWIHAYKKIDRDLFQDDKLCFIKWTFEERDQMKMYDRLQNNWPVKGFFFMITLYT